MFALKTQKNTYLKTKLKNKMVGSENTVNDVHFDT